MELTRFCWGHLILWKTNNEKLRVINLKLKAKCESQKLSLGNT